MNNLEGTISEIKTHGTLSLATVLVGDQVLSVMLIDTPHSVDYLKKDHLVTVLFKETEVILGKGQAEISILNEMHAVVIGIEEGKLLSKVSLDSRGQIISSVLMTKSLKHLKLAVGDSVKAYVKSNEIMISG